MKKIKIFLLMTMLVLSSGVNSLITASAHENVLDVSANHSVYKTVITSIYKLEGKMVDINSIYQLYDLNELPNFLLITFIQGGYAIVTSSSFELSEYSLETDRQVPYVNTKIESVLWIYGGPFNYIIKSIDNDYYDFYSDQILDFVPEKELIDLSDNIIEGLLLKEGIKDTALSYTRNPTSWIGIPSSRFSRYTNSTWTNNNNTCGPHAAGIMLAYYQDYLPNLVSFSSSVRSKDSSSSGTLISKLISSTTDPTSTTPQNVGVGTATFLNNFNTAGSYITCYYSSGGTWTTATNKISNSRPVCIGLSGIGGLHQYGWHWVTAYAYGTDADGNGYYRCNDNWGGSAVTIRTSWTIGIAYLNN